MPRQRLQCALAIGLALLLHTSADAELKLPALFSDQMVLQRDRPAKIWGWADAGDNVTVALDGKTAQATADANGRWQVSLDVPAVGGPYTVDVQAGEGEGIQLKNVLVGEVWICSGQSNMQWSVRASDDAEAEIKAANWPEIRLLSVRRTVASDPQQDFVAADQSGWTTCSPETVGEFSAVAYYFGRQLHMELDVPIGLINTSWGGTRAEAWTSREALTAEPSLQPLVQWWDQLTSEYDPKRAEELYQQQMTRWQQASRQAKQEGKPAPRRPQQQPHPNESQHRVSSLYNAMIAPLVPLSIRGAIWYQGESNVGRAEQYRTLFPTMIADWRARFEQGDFPFLFVQLAPYRYSPAGSPLPELWDAQLMTLKTVPNTGMAVTTDIGNVSDIHPTNKQEVGRRLALWALATTYGKQDLVYSGPIYKDSKREGDAIRIQFEHTGEGLQARGGEPLSHFQIAPADGPFVPATATIEGDSVVVRSEEVSEPAAVRFAWDQTAEPNLINSAGLPASPFRTDDRPLTTKGNRTP